jgi:hypothetical protein
MASETVVAAKILCEARSRQKLRELHVGQNFQQQNFNQNQALPSPLTARPQGIHSMKFSLILNFFLTLYQCSKSAKLNLHPINESFTFKVKFK